MKKWLFLLTLANWFQSSQANSTFPQNQSHLENQPGYYMDYKVELYSFPFIIIIGTISNSLTFLVMRRKKMRHQSTYFYMGVLAIADEMVLLVGCLNFWVYAYTGKSFIFLSVVSCKVTCMALYATLHFSVWIVVIMTVERYIAVALPLQANRLCTVKRAKIATSILACAVLCINFHFIITHSLIGDECKSTTEFYSMFMNRVWPLIDGVIYSFVPLSLLVLFNILILNNLFKASKSVKNFRQQSQLKQSSVANTDSLKRKSPTAKNNRFAYLCCYRRHESDTNSIKFINLSNKNNYQTTTSEVKPRTKMSLYSNNSSHNCQQSNFNRKLTIMLITVSTTFCLTSMPIVTLQQIEQAGLIKSSAGISVLRGLFLALQYLNHSINFFLYAITGKTFRREFVALLVSWKNFIMCRDEPMEYDFKSPFASKRHESFLTQKKVSISHRSIRLLSNKFEVQHARDLSKTAV